MKADIHPTYYDKVTVTCSCGNSFETGSTQPSLAVEVCSNCHPFYTGKTKLVDTAGRVDKFRKKLQEAAKAGHMPAAKRKKKRAKDSKEIKIG